MAVEGFHTGCDISLGHGNDAGQRVCRCFNILTTRRLAEGKDLYKIFLCLGNLAEGKVEGLR
jgi:hypothetical protein